MLTLLLISNSWYRKMLFPKLYLLGWSCLSENWLYPFSPQFSRNSGSHFFRFSSISRSVLVGSRPYTRITITQLTSKKPAITRDSWRARRFQLANGRRSSCQPSFKRWDAVAKKIGAQTDQSTFCTWKMDPKGLFECGRWVNRQSSENWELSPKVARHKMNFFSGWMVLER